MDGHTPLSSAAPVGIHEAKTNLSKLVAKAEAGEEIVLTRGGKPVARLVAFDPPARGVGCGEWADMPAPADDAFTPMTEEELDEAFGPGVLT
jgi:prevent-host-death family protein